MRETIIQFAIQKLLCRSQDYKISGDIKREFAIMSRRLALDFDTIVCNGKEKEAAEGN